MKNPFNRKSLIQVSFFIIFLVCWEIIALKVSNPKLIPDLKYLMKCSLPEIALFRGDEFPNLSGALAIIGHHISYTLIRIIVGLFIGIAMGIIYGLSIHYFYRSRIGNSFVLTILRSIPLLALIPLFLHWFGGNEMSVYLYIIFGVFIVVATNVYEAVLNIPPNYVHQAKILGAKKSTIFKTVIYKAIQPEIAASLINVVALCWAFSLGAEYLASSNGIGFLIYQSYLFVDIGKLIILSTLYASLGIISYFVAKKIIMNNLKWQ